MNVISFTSGIEPQSPAHSIRKRKFFQRACMTSVR